MHRILGHSLNRIVREVANALMGVYQRPTWTSDPSADSAARIDMCTSTHASRRDLGVCLHDEDVAIHHRIKDYLSSSQETLVVGVLGVFQQRIIIGEMAARVTIEDPTVLSVSTSVTYHECEVDLAGASAVHVSLFLQFAAICPPYGT